MTSAADPASPQTGRRILVVEDEFLIRMLLEDMLTDLGYDLVGVAGRVDEAGKSASPKQKYANATAIKAAAKRVAKLDEVEDDDEGRMGVVEPGTTQVQLPAMLRRALRYVPAAVLTAIWAPELMLQKGVLSIALGNERLLAGIVAIAIAWRYRTTFGTIIAGLIALHLFDWMF